jgi:hypothetical protein
MAQSFLFFVRGRPTAGWLPVFGPHPNAAVYDRRGVRLVEYDPAHFDLLQRAAERMGATALRHRPFVDHYYGSSTWCRLYLAMVDDETIGATIGVEFMRFQHGPRSLVLGFGSNFFSLQPGSGGLLFMQWVKSCDVGLVFGGSGDTHRMLQAQKWTYVPVKTYYFNPAYRAERREPAWRVTAKWIARHLTRPADLRRRLQQLDQDQARNVEVKEESDYDQTLLPDRSPFAFRYAPPVECLRWRYDTRLSFVRYRLFRILVSGRTAGYVIVNDAPDRLMVAHCDGDDPTTLAHGVLLALAEASREDSRSREIVLTACHPEMQRLYQRAGFVTQSRWDRQFVLGPPRRWTDATPDTSSWLVNLDWGDNGLRTPFLDEQPGGAGR